MKISDSEIASPALAAPEPGVQRPQQLDVCCVVTYSHPVVRWLLGDTLHPGGVELTSKLASRLGVGPGARVLDAGSGLGTSAVHLASTLGCTVTGITLEEGGVEAGYELARLRGVEHRVGFALGDLRDLGLPPESFDFVIMECVLSILEDKAGVLRGLRTLLRPGGGLGLTDVTVSGPVPEELRGVSGKAGCVGGALSLAGYGELLREVGFTAGPAEDCRYEAQTFVGNIGERLLLAEIAASMAKVHISESLLAEGRRLLTTAVELVRRGVLGYGLVVARKPEE